MAVKDERLKLTDQEITHTFADPVWAAKFPPILTIEQAATMLHVPVGTLRDWPSLSGRCSAHQAFRFQASEVITI